MDRAEELFESRQLRVELFEHAFLPVFDLVLRLARAQGFGQVVPEFEQACIEHLEDAADIARAVAIQIERASGAQDWVAIAIADSSSVWQETTSCAP